jgi:DNA-binding MarR family transcriptional regulator
MNTLPPPTRSRRRLKRLKAKEIMSTTVTQLRPTVAKERFDSNGARKAAIALLTAIYKTGRHGTMAEVLIALEVIDSNLEGKPHSMKSLSSKLGIPYTSVSRIVYSLTAEAQPGGVLKLVPDSKDRRRKHIELDTDALKRTSSQVRALEKAMIDYYGSSVYKLKKDQPN